MDPGTANGSAPPRAVVVGGGIGGLTAALVLRGLGWEGVVIERREAPAEVDTGFLLWSLAVRCLRGQPAARIQRLSIEGPSR